MLINLPDAFFQLFATNVLVPGLGGRPANLVEEILGKSFRVSLDQPNEPMRENHHDLPLTLLSQSVARVRGLRLYVQAQPGVILLTART
jgi:hypothetical protein